LHHFTIKKNKMKNPKVRFSFSRTLDSRLALIAPFIVTCMTNNAFFPNLAPIVTELAAAVTAYIASLEDAATKATESIAKKNRCRKVLIALLSNLGLSVNAAANGNSEMLDSSGFPMAKAPGPRTVGNPGMVYLKPGISSGMLEASVKPVRAAASYLFQISTTDPESGEKVEWISFGSTVSKFVFTNLEPRKQYWVRVIAVGARGQRVSGPVYSASAI
jgi:hypothetical protein